MCLLIFILSSSRMSKANFAIQLFVRDARMGEHLGSFGGEFRPVGMLVSVLVHDPNLNLGELIGAIVRAKTAQWNNEK